MGTSLLDVHTYGGQRRDSTNNLKCAEGDTFLNQISFIADTRLRSYEQELKSQNSGEWQYYGILRVHQGQKNLKEHRES